MGAGLLFVTAAVSVSAAWAVVMPRLDRMSLRPFRARPTGAAR
ncbi:hypothetical protein [Streptomyces radiopugnans]|uniref:Uncharacterized protein n=1 Tax=Streptomyces radiopugnans TaxID=403935 RepID=A0A1H9BMS3_9ACTN|nr:hypothetical protein [Streptomyces radiopugnans]SEP90051.1 hypothetical protein SAMN05216481_102475 [Streptomyces radiopugnans]